MTGTITALVGCQIQGCAEDISYPIDMVAMWKGAPICQDCWENADLGDEGVDWNELPEITLKDLKE